METMRQAGIRPGALMTALLIGAAVLVSGCDKTRSIVGLEKQAPDEFAVVPHAPLSLPPDYGLRPPAPGAERPQEGSVRNQAREVLIKESDPRARAEAVSSAAASREISRGEAALLASAGALNADPSIRTTINRETSALVEADKSILDKVLFWQEPATQGSVVDADKESRRLREANATGEPPNKGEVPVIKRRERGILEGIF